MRITVAQLIEDLQKFPKDLVVLTGNPNGKMELFKRITMLRAVARDDVFIPSVGVQDNYEVVLTLD